ncbi:MAG: C45 family peptidase [Desulfobacterales bacterium]|nr:C45 family peptidase [Desulfobacterales bacterium]
MEFRKISVHGTHEEIGLQYGKQLQHEIRKNINFYVPYIKSILNRNYSPSVEKFKHAIKGSFPHLYIEIEHIALGAGVDMDDLIAMNARTELLLGAGFNECTAVVIPDSGILAQNWDWTSKLEETTVIVEIIYPDDRKILMLTEAGIIGKIGMNNNHLGVTLNILHTEGMHLNGPPIHLIMRGILEQKTLNDAISYIRRMGAGTSSNLIISDGQQAYEIEYAGVKYTAHQIQDKYYAHTNHFLHQDGTCMIYEDDYDDSAARLKTAHDRLDRPAGISVESVKSLLSDQSHPEYNILADYEPYLDDYMGLSGTIATVIMEPGKGAMTVRKGNPSIAKFDMEGFKKYSIA